MSFGRKRTSTLLRAITLIDPVNFRGLHSLDIAYTKSSRWLLKYLNKSVNLFIHNRSHYVLISHAGPLSSNSFIIMEVDNKFCSQRFTLSLVYKSEDILISHQFGVMYKWQTSLLARYLLSFLSASLELISPRLKSFVLIAHKFISESSN